MASHAFAPIGPEPLTSFAEAWGIVLCHHLFWSILCLFIEFGYA